MGTNQTEILLLFASASVEEAGPLKAGLLTAHPENGGDPHHQHHHVFDQEQSHYWPAGLFNLTGAETCHV